VAIDNFQELEDRWAAIVSERDVVAADRLLSDTFVLSSRGGVAPNLSKEEWLAALPSTNTRELASQIEEVRVYGDVAVVVARLAWQADTGGRDLSGVYAVTDVFKREHGRWRADWRISTRLPVTNIRS
jgi:Domain of unknown function (DUF4440)